MKMIQSHYFAALLLAILSASSTFAYPVNSLKHETTPPLQSSSYGTIDRIYLDSPEMKKSMTIDILLPDGYLASDSVRYPVIYMHDGQNLFDASTTWNHQAWEVDSVMRTLAHHNLISPAIVVGIHSTAETRIGDLMPQKPVESLNPTIKDSLAVSFPGIELRGDEYASFVAHTLKDYVDNSYRTLPDRNNTSVMGSSMGGIMSIYEICEYPEIYGNAAALSTHWIGYENGDGVCSQAFRDYLDQHMPDPTSHRIYLDRGTEHIDAFYGEANNHAIDLLRNHGYVFPRTLFYIEDRGAGHQESFWARRLELPLLFLLHR